MTASSPYTSDNETFTVDPYDNLTNDTIYKVRVTTGVKDPAGNPMSSDNTTGTGWTSDGTAPSAPIVSGTTPTQETTPTWSWSSGGGGNGTYRYKLDDSDLTSGATQTTNTSYTPGSGISEASHTLFVQEQDADGQWSSSGSRTIVIDNTAPTVTLTDDHSDLRVKDADNVVITATFNDSMTSAPTISINVADGTDADISATAMSGSGTTWTYTFDVPSGHDGNATVTVAGTNVAGNAYAGSDTIVYIIDNTAPTVSGGIAISGASGVQNNLLNAGDVVSVTATFSENVSVAGTPQLTLVVGTTDRTATYTSGSGGTTLVFTYTIQAGETDSNGISIEANKLALNSGTISDGAGNNATLTHSAVSANSSYMVDTTAPTANFTAATDDVGTVTGTLSSGDTTNDTALVLSGTNESGASVKVYNDSTELGAATVSGTSWSYSATVADSTTYQFNVTETDLAGNTSSATSNFAITGDTTGPTQTVSGVDIDPDTGTSNSDFITKTAAQTITGTLSANIASTDTLYGSVNNGSTWDNISSKVSGTGITWNGATLSGSSNILFKITDAVGNDGSNTGSQAYVLDTTAPTLTITMTNTGGQDPYDIKSGDNNPTIWFNFSEAPSGFAAADITVQNGSIGSTLAVNGSDDTLYTATFTYNCPVNDSSNEVTVGQNWSDAAGNAPANNSTSPNYAIDADC